MYVKEFKVECTMIICNTKKLTSDDNICAGAHDVAYNDNGIMVKQVATTTTIITYSAIMSISQTAECDKVNMATV